MELFQDPLTKLAACLEEARAGGVLREYEYNPFSAWPEQPSLVLQEDTAVELGGTGSSLFLILWTGTPGLIRPGRISVIGPELNEASRRQIPFTQIVVVRGAFQEEYETYQALRDAVFDTRFKGVSTRIWPDRHRVWCRVSGEALTQGFNFMRCGCTLIKRITSLPAVEGAEVIFASGAVIEGAHLHQVAEKAQDIVEALLKMYEEMNFDCESCEYSEVCEEVAGLKEIHRRLHEEREL